VHNILKELKRYFEATTDGASAETFVIRTDDTVTTDEANYVTRFDLNPTAPAGFSQQNVAWYSLRVRPSIDH